mmetsp:Transcript_50945/g.101260  ORF Transcript_50945/g.101260 Transcript_50945/m.101260 type:complete len:87 (-) Transcript_50945:398-658(-)
MPRSEVHQTRPYLHAGDLMAMSQASSQRHTGIFLVQRQVRHPGYSEALFMQVLLSYCLQKVLRSSIKQATQLFGTGTKIVFSLPRE